MAQVGQAFDTGPTSRPLPARLLVFDAECILCSGAARWIVGHDREQSFYFATAQSPLGQNLLRAHGLRTDDFDSNLVLIDGAVFTRLGSIIAVSRVLGWPWRAAGALELLPQPVQDWLYDRIAKNRFRLFGRKASCDIPDAGLRSRIVG